MTLTTIDPRATMRAIALAVAALLAASLLLVTGTVSQVRSAAVTVNPATGGSAIKADTAGTGGGSGAWTTLTGPQIIEDTAGQLVDNGTIVLTAPTGFEFNTSASVTVGAGGTGCAGLTFGSVTKAATTLSVTVQDQSTSPCTASFSGIQVRPTVGTPLRSGNITNTGNTGPGGSTNYGTLNTVVGDPSKVTWTQQPASSVANLAFPTQPQVTVQDAVGNTVDDDTTVITIEKAAAPGGTLTCNSLSVTATNGIATFAGCRLSAAGLLAQLQVDTSSALPDNVGSALFDITDNLAWETNPGGGSGAGGAAVGGVAFTTQPRIAVRVGSSKAVNDDTTLVTLAIRSGTGTSGAVLACDAGSGLPANTVRAVDGTAQFTNCRIDRAGTGYQLAATSNTGLSQVFSASFNVVAGPATKLAFIQQPTGGNAGAAFPLQPIVAITDAGTNVVTTGVSTNVTLSLASSTVAGSQLTCTSGLTQPTFTSGPNAGRAIFSGCRINNAGTFTLQATPSGTVPGSVNLASATSAPFTLGAPQAAISLSASASVIRWGEGVNFTIVFGTNGANKTFFLEGVRDKATQPWTTIATLTTNGQGVAVFQGYTPVTNLFYRVRFAGSPDLVAGMSSETRVVVRQRAVQSPRSLTTIGISRGRSITFATTVRPSRPELPKATVTFEFWRYSSGAWRRVTTRAAVIDSAGVARTTFTFTSVGQWRVRSYAMPTPYNANSMPTPFTRYSVR